MLAKDVKPGAVVNYQGGPIMIEGVNVQSPTARGAATLYKFRGRNLVTRQKVDINLKGTDNLDEADFQRRSAKFMYADPTHMHFLDQEDYNQYALEMELLEEQAKYITERLEGIMALIYNDECVGLQLPAAAEMVVTQCDPTVRGNSATGRTKPATLETGLVVQVPEYLEQGEIIKVDTRTGQFLSRA